METETGNRMENGIILVTGSNGRIGGAVMRRFAGRFSDVVVHAEGSSEWTLPMLCAEVQSLYCPDRHKDLS